MLRQNGKGTSEGDKGLPEAPRGTLAYIFNTTQAWVYTVTVYSPNKKVLVLRAVVITGLIFLMLSLLSMVRMHGVHGGAHHLLGGPSE